jgi:hypothetical protein
MVPFLQTSSPPLLSHLFNYSHPDRCEMIYPCGFNSHFPIISGVEDVFINLLVIYVSFGETSIF